MTGADEGRPGPAGTALCVVCEEYADAARFPRLVGAGAQMDEIVGLLEGLGYETRKVGGGDPSSEAFRRESEEWSEGWVATGIARPALVIWSGHGVRVDGQTRLVLSDLKPVADPGQWKARVRRHGVIIDDLVSEAVGSGAEHVLLVVDTCYAGGGAVPAMDTALGRWAEESAPPGHAKWLGFLASCQSHETSDGSGPLLAALAEVLRAGPAGSEYRSAWSDHNAFVSGPDLMSAIATRWDDGQGQTPVPASVGDGRPVFPNPLHSPGAPARLVEHLVQAARGVGPTEEGWFFTGRTRVLGRIVEWLGEDAPGLFLVTGPAGCGKSAVLGRIATLADPEQRARAEENGALRVGDPDPGVRAERTLAAVHLRDLTPLQASERLARALGLPRPRNTDDFRAEVRELSPQPVLVIDGLDEVPAEHTQSMIEDLVFPLSRTVPVLLGSRERPFRNKLEDNESLVQALARHIGAGVTAVDLEVEPHTQNDIGEYVRRRCEAARVAEGLARDAGAAIAERATDVGGGFLFARLVTSTVLARVGSEEDGALLTELPDSIDAAFEDELRAVPARVRDDGTVLPSAAWDLLSALAWTVGQGMPAGGVWEAVAGALGGGVEYDESDVDWALSVFGRYIVEDAEEGQAVYRLYHREFVAHLMRREGLGGTAADEVVLRTLVELVKRQGRVGDWSGVDPYVTRGLVGHAVRCGGAGVEMLRGVVAWDGGCGPTYLAAAMHRLSQVLSKSGLRDEALVYSREAVDHYEQLCATSAENYLPDLAACLNNLAVFLSDMGDRQGALTPAQKATNLYRTLAEQHPTAFTPDLAASLNNLANQLANTGDRQGALAAAQDAVHIRRALTEQHPTTFTHELATSLNNLAVRLADVGDRQGALAPAHEATNLYRTLAEQHPTTFTPHLATALNNLAYQLANTGDRQGALAPAHEATNLYRTLAEQHPTAFTPDLAGSLNNLANRLAGVGDRRGALVAAQDAVHIRRALTEQHPTAFTHDLAASLSNLANRLADVGDRQGALAPAHEATDIYRTLAEQHPTAFTHDLATALNNLAYQLANTGDRQGALAPAHEATNLYRTLAEQHPTAFTPDLAGILNNLANHLADMGDHQGALAPAHEATDIYRTLAEQHPTAFTPHLAGSLSNLANHLGNVGDHQGALAPAHEAVHIRRALAEQHPTTFTHDLAASLNNLANCLASVGDHQGALAPAHEAANLYRALAQQHPTAFTPHLATALSNLASRLADVGDRQGALAPAHEAVHIRRALAEQHPTTFTHDLAASLNNLANCLASVGDRRGALTAAHEAVQLRRALAEQHPTTFTPHLAASLNNLANQLADSGDLSGAIHAYERVIADLSPKRPTAGRAITLERDTFLISRTECSAPAGLRGLARLASTPTAEVPDQVTFRARGILRRRVQESAAHHEELTTIWQDETAGSLPAWLALSPEALDTVAKWLTSPTWSDSYTHWTEHAELLSDPEAAAALTEYALLDPEAVAEYEALREEILTRGAPAAYHPLIVGEQLADWAASTTWEESEQFLRAHPDLLATDPPAFAPPTPAALLHAARTHDIPTAYALVRDRTALQQHIDNALTSGDAEALRHAASIEYEVYDDQLSAHTHHQAALLLAGTPDEADPESLAPLVADASPDTRNRLISETAALSAAHAPQHAAHWARIIQALATTG
ncbi:tetratricopeptide repeat protein [Streptomyces castrisilvae]|uniref:Tetratricopeptide repeat protein n=1 Tax=Streptomyces castrisilvae TaxID=3033811 RepID=A0ABY9HGF5_9ACTN|nr:tetratricopeptide repeat protein [Streptomyces sp. Mut1]WLQ33386.1 tetratricopeptide repeat protein [Streptomyces sp. Mut1]